MSLVYLAVIAPFVLAYRSLLDLFVHYTASYTISVALVALAHIFVTAPFRRLARRLPVDLRAPFTLTFHLPFLAAFYYILSETPAPPVDLFSFVPDGRKPDALLGSINLLPIVALILQLLLVSLFPYRSSKGRLVGVLAALALATVLYWAPAYLLLFWIVVLALSISIKVWFLRHPEALSDITPIARDAFSWAQRLLFVSAVLVLALLLCVFGPTMLYLSDPHAYFNQGVFQVLRSSLPVMGLIVLAAFTIWTSLPRAWRGALCKGSTFSAIACLLFASSNLPDYGVIDGFLLSRASSVTTYIRALADVATLLVAAFITWALFRYKRPLEIVAFFFLISTTLIGYPLFLSITRTPTPEVPRAERLQAALDYSKDGKNTLIFVLDMFTGTHIKQMLDDSPTMMMKFTGFTWYPDTLAGGNITLIGMPPIMGGHDYLPSGMNKAVGSTNAQKLARAHAHLPKAFAEAGNTASLINVPFYFDSTLFLQELGDAQKNVHFVQNAVQTTYKPDMKATGSSLYSIAVSLFRMSPNLLRGSIYQGGRWLGAADVQDTFRATKGEVSFLTSLPALSSAKSPTDTFKVLYSLLPHCYYHLQKDVVEFVEDPDPSTPNQPSSHDLGSNISPEHYYTEQHTMRFLGSYFDWLREQGIYDNTKIILVSDHSWFDSRMLSDAFGGDHSYPGRPAGLLMIKDFNATGPLKISQHFLSTADVPFFACSHMSPERCEPQASVRDYLRQVALTDTPIDRERTHSVTDQWGLDRHPSDTFQFKMYRVRNSMFDRNHWEEVTAPY
jgi:hypothetical protein